MGEQFSKIEALLLDIRERVERLEARFKPEPTAFRYPEAAERLGIGVTTLKAMVKARKIRPTREIGGVPMIPLSEIVRVSTPEAERPKVERETRAKAWTPITKKRR